jgi:hypothetical protein
VGTAEDCARRLDEIGVAPLSPQSGEQDRNPRSDEAGAPWGAEPGRAGKRMAALARVVTALLRPVPASGGA